MDCQAIFLKALVLSVSIPKFNNSDILLFNQIACSGGAFRVVQASQFLKLIIVTSIRFSCKYNTIEEINYVVELKYFTTSDVSLPTYLANLGNLFSISILLSYQIYKQCFDCFLKQWCI